MSDNRRLIAELAWARMTHEFGMDWAEPAPFDTGRVHGPENRRVTYLGQPVYAHHVPQTRSRILAATDHIGRGTYEPSGAVERHIWS